MAAPKEARTMRKMKIVAITMIVLTAFVGGWVVGGRGSSPAQAQTQVLSHFKCYTIQPGHNPPQVVDLQDQFHFEKDVKVNRAKMLCTPVLKTNVRPPGQPDPPNADHLKCYAIKQPQLVPPRVVDLKNQFGAELNTNVLTPKFLCVPTNKVLH
jgi:hypothetical protein